MPVTRASPFPAALLAATVVATSGCASSALVETTGRYYAEGPETAIAAVEQGRFRPADSTLAALEKAVALLELGAYEESADLLRAAGLALAAARRDPGTTLASLAVNDEAGAYRAEAFELVMVPTLTMAATLAVQDLPTAAAEAELALALIDRVGCPGCRFPFTRYLAAVAFDALADRSRALEVLAEAVAESPGDRFLEAELDRLAAEEECPADDEEAPATLGGRTLYLLLLLGRGPAKVQDGVPVPWSHVVAWPRYVPRQPEGVTAARLELSGSAPVRSAELSDMLELADASLHARLAGLIGKEGAKTAVQELLLTNLPDSESPVELVGRMLFALADRADLRHWSTLPASCQVVRAEVPAELAACDLVYLTGDGREIDRETLPLPPDWTEGPLFVTRRMP